MTQDDDEPPKTRKVTHALPKILQNGPVILFGFRGMPGPFPGTIETGPTNPIQPTGKHTAVAKAADEPVAKNRITIIEDTAQKTMAFLQTGRPLPPDETPEKGS